MGRGRKKGSINKAGHRAGSDTRQRALHAAFQSSLANNTQRRLDISGGEFRLAAGATGRTSDAAAGSNGEPSTAAASGDDVGELAADLAQPGHPPLPTINQFWLDVGSKSNIHLRPEVLLAVAQPIVPHDKIESIIRNSVQTYLRGSSAEFQNRMIAPDFLEDGSMPAAMAAQTGNAALEDLVEANMGEPLMQGEASTDTRPHVRLMLKFVRCISQILTQNSPF
jgi:hypothetical protein